jgi:hypothetical protein
VALSSSVIHFTELFGRPTFLRSFHGWATVVWFGISLPLAMLYGSSVVFVTFLSLYAIVVGHWSSWQAARVEVKQDARQRAGPDHFSSSVSCSCAGRVVSGNGGVDGVPSSNGRRFESGRNGKASHMASETRTTTDHDEIRTWVEAHGGKPASVKGTEKGREDAGVLRVDFPGGAGEEYFDHLEWDQFFQKFDQENLAFLYQERKADGSDSTFHKFIAREG